MLYVRGNSVEVSKYTSKIFYIRCDRSQPISKIDQMNSNKIEPFYTDTIHSMDVNVLKYYVIVYQNIYFIFVLQ